MMSAKLTAVSFLAITALAAGSIAFAGCTVTSSPTNIEGGSGNPPVTGDSSTGTDSATPPGAAKCEGNKQASGDFVNAQCQAVLNANCCTELKGCFNLEVDQDAGGATADCDTYVKCVDLARKQPTMAEQEEAQKECDLASPKSVQDAYDAIVKCASDADGGLSACQ